MFIYPIITGLVAQSVTCHCRYMTDCRSMGGEFDPGPVPYFRKIGHEIISKAILLPSADSRRVLVT